ncbi:hypothetical protein DID78_01625 [Candidatus Marinamargulisbacteria bacterium SCGC AG-343-D04]|nr:hypothetical protein DID78_01625 [Candidatus Marinamargulisbacteria bacterium SCGC AG-343-D04]
MIRSTLPHIISTPPSTQISTPKKIPDQATQKKNLLKEITEALDQETKEQNICKYSLYLDSIQAPNTCITVHTKDRIEVWSYKRPAFTGFLGLLEQTRTTMRQCIGPISQPKQIGNFTLSSKEKTA